MTAENITTEMKNNVYPFVADEIKRQLKTKSISYKYLADYLHVSEKTITRSLNNHQELSLERLSSICSLLNTQLSHLFTVAERNMSTIHYFTEKQDIAMVERPELYHLLNEVYEEQDINTLAKQAGQTQAQMYLNLRELEKIDLITIGTNNTVVLNVPKHTVFHPNSRYAAKIKRTTLEALSNACCQPIENQQSILKIVNVELTDEEHKVFQNDMSHYFLQLVRDQHKKTDSKRTSFTMALMVHEGHFYPDKYKAK